MPKAWNCISLGDKRQYGGNIGYDDDLSSRYEYDSNVANHRQVAEGDVIVIRDRKRALGVARIEQITTTQGTKLIRRCPECHTTSIKERATKHPTWRCVHRHLFEEPEASEKLVTKYSANFGGTYVPIQQQITVALLKSIAIRPNDQLSIEELDLGKLENLIDAGEEKSASLVIAAGFQTSANPDEADDEPEKPISAADERKKIMRAIKVRRGQAAFRRNLFNRYGNRCMVTGCKLEDLLEAAHIAPYRNESHNNPRNGLLLRADIHTLFDLFLMQVDPNTLVVTFHEKVKKAGYAGFDGKQLLVGKNRPSITCLKIRAAMRLKPKGAQNAIAA
jgi:hypothetical protein